MPLKTAGLTPPTFADISSLNTIPSVLLSEKLCVQRETFCYAALSKS